MRILIAEDDRTSLSILSAILKKLGHDPVAVEEGNSAWDIMQKIDAPQIAILDWEMPGLDGPALCQKLRNQDRKDPLYLILLTSRKDTQDIVQGLEAGADDYMIKPYHHAELQARVNAGCRMIEIQNKMMEQEKLQGVLEMAGALCHELNQPLQVVLGLSEIILMDINAGDPNFKNLKNIKDQIDRIGKVTQKIMTITRYQSKPYLKSKIVDIDRASAG
ncbi:MAG: response regulator [Desulfobacula sp.]|nr:response regulator [Desulfobacula sp.]